MLNSDPFEAARADFAKAMNDDLNTPQAIAVLFDTTREVNGKLADADPAYLNAARAFYEDLLGKVLGVVGEVQAVRSSGGDDTLGGVLELVLNQRQEARRRRDFKTSDSIRDRLAELGIQIEDTVEGSRWKLGG